MGAPPAGGLRHVDFDDMLLMATEHISRAVVSPTLLDGAGRRFQDTSRAKVRMLKALLKNAGEGAHLCVVGTTGRVSIDLPERIFRS